MIDIEKSEKLPRERRYFNISTLWIFYFRWVIALLYHLKIRHEVVTLLSILAGLISAFFFYHGILIAAALALHLKDLFDACDGALARLTGKGHLIGRYLDSLGDFLVLVAVVAAIAIRAAEQGQSTYLLWSAFAALSIFIQCSFFNYYQLAYLEQFQINSLISRRDEAHRHDLKMAGERPLLKVLHLLYVMIYSWQDRLVAAVDNHMFKRYPYLSKESWYGEKIMMTLISPLCFGTHVFVIIIGAFAGRPEYGLIFIATVMNLYLMLVLYCRSFSFARGRSSAQLQEGTTCETKR